MSSASAPAFLTTLAESLAAVPGAAPMLGFVAGLVLGAIHFASLRLNTDLFVEGGRAWLAALLLVGRFALLLVVLAALALLGALPLLCAALGLLVARSLIIKRMGGVS